MPEACQGRVRNSECRVNGVSIPFPVSGGGSRTET